MDHFIKIQDKTYRLAASVTDGDADIYGQTLLEVCQFHELSVKRVKSSDLKAVERGKYALFMLGQIMNFDPCDYRSALNRIILLCDNTIETLTGMDSRNNPVYSAHISACRNCRRVAAELKSMR